MTQSCKATSISEPNAENKLIKKAYLLDMHAAFPVGAYVGLSAIGAQLRISVHDRS